MLYTIVNKFFRSNSYILSDEINKRCLIIDPGLYDSEISQRILELNLRPTAIISTHGHFDHIGSVSILKSRFDVPFYLHEADLKLCQSANFFLKMAHLNYTIDTPSPDFLFKGEMENLSIFGFNLAIYNFPGHSPGSCIIKYDNLLFSGDIIFKHGIGLGTIPKENKQDMKRSIFNIFNRFSEKDLICPGHGSSEYLGLIKKNNLELKKFLLSNDVRNE